MMAAMMAALALTTGPYSGVSVENLLDTPSLKQDIIWQADATALAALSKGARVVEEDGRQILLTEKGFTLTIARELPEGKYRLEMECWAPNRGTDSLYVAVDGKRMSQIVVLRVGEFGRTAATLPVQGDGMHKIEVTLREAPGSKITVASLSRTTVTPPNAPILAELRTQHPRLLLTPERLAELRKTYATDAYANIYQLPGKMRKLYPYRKGKRNGGIYRGLGDQILGYLLKPDPAKLAEIIEWLEMATTYGDVGVDLDAEYFMEGIALGYDWLYDELPEDLRKRLGARIAELCEQLYAASLAGKTGGGHSFQQNHYWFAHLSLALGAGALVGDHPQAEEWLAWAWDRFERIAVTFSPDGGFHEGPSYWDYSMPTLYIYVDLYEGLSGRKVPGMEGLKGQAAFRMHHILPGLKESAPLEDSKVHMGISAAWLQRWEAQRYQAPLTQGVAAALYSRASSNKLALLWHDPKLAATADALSQVPEAKYYPDIETVFARTSWTRNDATFLAFVCRPLGGHSYAEICDRYGLSGTGHNHPEQGHFFLFAQGEILAGDPGYTYKKETRNHNTILVDGKGQLGDGEMWPHPKPGRAHITSYTHKDGVTVVTGDATSAYPAELGLERFERTVVLAGPELVVIYDQLAAKEPRTFSWLLHHWGETESEADARIVKVNDARLRVQPLLPAAPTVKEETYRPQFVHPRRNLTPKVADIHMIQLDTQPARTAQFLVPLVIGSAAAPPVVPKALPCTNGQALVCGTTVVAFRTGDATMQLTLPSGKDVNSKARVLIARQVEGRTTLTEVP